MHKADLAMAADGRRKHEHWRVTLRYIDGETFGRVYTNREKAERFAARQKRSPIVKGTRVDRIS